MADNPFVSSLTLFPSYLAHYYLGTSSSLLGEALCYASLRIACKGVLPP